MSKKSLIALLITVGTILALPQSAAAHVLIGDSSKSIGAVLHIMPDDDPIAGQQSNLFFDIQTQNISKATLTITNAATGEANKVPTKVTANTVTADYIFPTQGAYNLALTLKADKTYSFSHAQRVTRGVFNSALDKPTYPLASLALVFCGTAFLVLVILLFNHRKELWRDSTF